MEKNQSNFRRGPNDEKWQEVKEKVLKRDNGSDRFFKVITAKEYCMFRYLSKHYLSKITPAHVIPVSTHPSLMYNENNLITLNITVHSRLDNNIDPITNKSINSQKVKEWWKRLLGEEQYKALIQEDEARRWFL
jgi:hypothetical protein